MFVCNTESCFLDIRGLIPIFHAETADGSTYYNNVLEKITRF